MHKGVLILECLDKDDPGSEGRFLSHMFNLMGVNNQYIEVRTKDQLLALLKKSPYHFIHITTHGDTEGFWTRTDFITAGDLKHLEGELRGHIVVSTACLTGKRDFRKEFTRMTRCLFYIAPEKEVKFANSIFFAHIFYHHYFVLKETNVEKIVSQFDKKYKNVHKFKVTSLKDLTNGHITKVIMKIGDL